MRDVKSKGDGGQSIQQVDVSAEQHMKTEDPLFGWTATDRPLEIPPDNIDPAKFDDKETQRSERKVRTGTERGGGRAYHRTEFQNEV